MRATLALAVLVFVPGLLDPFVVPKTTIVLACGAAGLAAWIADALAGRRPRGRPALADVAVAAWVIALVFSALTGLSPRLSWAGEIEQREGLRTAFALAGVYALARRAHAWPRDAHGTIDTAILAGTLAAAYALVQFAGLDPLRWTRQDWYPAGGRSLLRPASTLGNAVLLGAVLAAALSMCVARLCSGRAGRAWTVPAAALMGAALAATLSRGALFAATAGMAAAAVGALANRGTRAARDVAIALAAAALPAAAWGAIALRGAFGDRLAEGATALSGPGRAEIARAALALWRTHPWLGIGPDTFGLAFPAVQTTAFWSREWVGLPVHAHSAALQALATTGALGGLAGLAWVIFALAGARRGARAGQEARTASLEAGAGLVALAAGGVLNPVGIAGATLFAVLAALATGLGREERGPSPTAPGAAPVAALAGALLVCGLAIPEWAALRAAGQARDAFATLADVPTGGGGRALAVAHAQSRLAVARAPGEDELWRLACDVAIAEAEAARARGLAATVRAAAADAERFASRAVALQSDRASNHQRLANARVESVLGGAGRDRMRAADASFAEARRLAPRDGLVLADEARAELTLGLGVEALETARRIVDLYPQAAQGHALEGAALLLQGRRADALVALRRALAVRWEDGSEPQRRAAEATVRVLAGP